MLVSPTTQPQLQCLSSWEKDLHCTFFSTQRQRIISLSLKSSLCTKLQETNFKILTRWYLTPSRLKKCFPSTSGQCWRCMEGEGTLIHIFWSCSKLREFWDEVRRITQKFTDYALQDDPAFWLLHLSSIPIKS